MNDFCYNINDGNAQVSINSLVYSRSPLSSQDLLVLKRLCKSKLNKAVFSKNDVEKRVGYGAAFASFRCINSFRPDARDCVGEVVKDFESKILSDYFTNIVRDTYVRKNGTAEELVSRARDMLSDLGVNGRSLDVVIDRMRKAYRPKHDYKDVVG